MLLSFVVILSLQVQPSTQQQPFELHFERMGDVITFRCRNTSDSSAPVDINVEENTNINFYLNLTQGDHVGPSNLDKRLSPEGLSRNGVTATFQITRGLNGHYSCGTGPEQQSNIRTIISIVTTNIPDNLQTDYTAQAGAESVTLRCPYEPASLINCYFGGWKKGSESIVTVQRPGIGVCTPEDTLIENTIKYRLDKITFSLVINSPQASTDNGEYYCELSVLNPDSARGFTFSYPTDIMLTLTVGDHFNTSTFPSDDNGAQDQGPNSVVLKISVIVLAVITLLLFVALAVMCLLFARSRFKMRNETLYQSPYYSQPTIPLPEEHSTSGAELATPNITLNRNLAYESNAAVAPEIATEENIAYIYN